jgi:hypothetical protein
MRGALGRLVWVAVLVPSLARPMGGSVPPGLPGTFVLGVANGNPGTLNWVLQTRAQNGACWDAHYQYLAGGVNTDVGWETWNDPPGQFITYFAQDAAANGLLPVFTYYEIVPSTPNAYDESRTLVKLQNAALMRDYYQNYKLALDKIRGHSGPVILHVEPDLWGTIHASVFDTSNDPAAVPVSVGSSGYAPVAGFANNAAGFSQALVDLRDRFAPSAILAIHYSAWANNDLFHCTGSCPKATVDFELAKSVEFFGRLMSPRRWDLLFADPDDRDADFHYLRGRGNRWLSPSATNIGGPPPSFERMLYILNALSDGLQMRSMLWQLPIGNSYYKTCNNSDWHTRDNLVEYFLPPVGAYGGPQDAGSAIGRFAAAGVIGLLFGSGGEETTHFTDLRGDGVTNPNSSTPGAPGFSVWGQAQSVHPDDDGGYLRLGSAAYCAAGRYVLPGAPGGEEVGAAALVPAALALALLGVRVRSRR